MPLPAKMGSATPTNPCPLGFIKVPVPGTAVKLTSNWSDIDQRNAHWMNIRALDSNQGIVYVIVAFGPSPPWNLPGGGTTSGADTANGMNILQQLSAGESWAVPSQMLNQIQLGQFWIDAVNANEGVVSSFYEA